MSNNDSYVIADGYKEYQIRTMLKERKSQDYIAKTLHTSKSTISDIKSFFFTDDGIEKTPEVYQNQPKPKDYKKRVLKHKKTPVQYTSTVQQKVDVVPTCALKYINFILTGTVKSESRALLIAETIAVLEGLKK